MEKFVFRKLQFSGSGVQFSSLGEFAEILFSVHNLGLIYCIELAKCSMEAEFNPTYDGEKKKSENYNFQSQGKNFQIWANLPKSSILFISWLKITA